MPKIVRFFTKLATNGNGPLPTERQLAFGWRPCRPVTLEDPENCYLGSSFGGLLEAQEM